jgi:hypothetical protein
LPIYPELGAEAQGWIVHNLEQILGETRGRRKAG